PSKIQPTLRLRSHHQPDGIRSSSTLGLATATTTPGRRPERPRPINKPARRKRLNFYSTSAPSAAPATRGGMALLIRAPLTSF
uniref:Uncharacterized protein n=1 Tax=Aegilops tauschii subsp. strangulata TaxID=200361 RepID=A0A453MDQ6_AEGTS